MAAIDKLYVHSHYEYDELRRWAIAYFPKLLFYFFNIDTSFLEWEDNRKNWVKSSIDIAKRDYDKIVPFSSISEAEFNLKKHYKKSADYDCPTKQAIEETKYIIDMYNMTEDEWEDKYTCPIMSTPIWIDKKLLWICPIPFVREYLEKQCGYKTRWYHKLFWRGKKHF